MHGWTDDVRSDVNMMKFKQKNYSSDIKLGFTSVNSILKVYVCAMLLIWFIPIFTELGTVAIFAKH